MPAASVFVPDPLLARTVPKAAAGFDALPLLVPAPVSFRQDPLLSPPAGHAAQSHVFSADGADVEGAGEEGMQQTVHPASAETDAGGDGAVLAPSPQAWAAELEQRYREGFEEGLAEGARLAADAAHSAAQEQEAAAEAEHSRASRDAVLLLESLSRALQPLLLPDDAATRFEPLKRLALHLAMELVRTELSVSPRVVESLVLRSVQALQADETAPLTVELHPQDLAVLRQTLQAPDAGLAPDAPLLQRVHWKEDPTLTRGSVRARSDVSTVEDLIQHRLASLIQELRIEAVQWQQDEAALQDQVHAGAPDV